MRLSGPPMLVTKLAEQALRPKRIGSLALPLAPFGGPLIAGVRQICAHAGKSKSAHAGKNINPNYFLRTSNL